jgi:putative flippase GtrA
MRRLAASLLADQRVRYLAVGGWNTVSSYLLFVGLELAFGDVVNYLVLLVVTMILSVLQAFVLHRRLVFHATDGHWPGQLLRFSQVYAGAFAVNLALLPVLVELVGLPVIVAQGVLVVTTVAASFVGHRRWSFGR